MRCKRSGCETLVEVQANHIKDGKYCVQCREAVRRELSKIYYAEKKARRSAIVPEAHRNGCMVRIVSAPETAGLRAGDRIPQASFTTELALTYNGMGWYDGCRVVINKTLYDVVGTRLYRIFD
jgi:hypothetical protein